MSKQQRKVNAKRSSDKQSAKHLNKQLSEKRAKPQVELKKALPKVYEESKAPRLKFSTEWQYGPSLEATDHVKLEKKYGLFLSGKFVEPQSGQYFVTTNPAAESSLAEVAVAGKQDVALAIESANKAFDVWSKMPGKERGKYLFRLARLIQEKAKELAIIETLDSGKPLRESRSVDIPLAAAHFFYHAGWADKLQYVVPGGHQPQPLGVVGQIIPWNFPLLMAAWKVAPALATGNTVVLKPAESTPLTALKLAEIFQQADLPPGVLNIITGGDEVGVHLVATASMLKKIAFTGSTEVGKRIQKSLVGTGCKATLELGGKSANIIFEDAAIDQAVEGVINAIFFNQGHVCCAGSRLLVQESVASMVIRKLQDRMESLRVGDPLDKNTDIGAINSKAQLERINSYIEWGLKEGASLYQNSCSLPNKGYWCRPTLFTGVAQSHRIVQEEIFGPVLAIQTFRTPEEAIEKANNSPYGLAGGIWTEKGSKAFKVASQIKAGALWVNTYNKFDPTSPFGGFKESGIGREGGLHGLLPYLIYKE